MDSDCQCHGWANRASRGGRGHRQINRSGGIAVGPLVCRSYEGDRRPRSVCLVRRMTLRKRRMSQFSGCSQAAVDTNSSIIGALELNENEKKWVLAVQQPGVSRHSRHALDACGDGLVGLLERLKARCAASGRKIARVILAKLGTTDFGWRVSLLNGVSRSTSSSLRASRVDRRARRAKTDMIDVEMLLRTLMAWLGAKLGSIRWFRSRARPTRKRGARTGNGRI
jgi:hypothetical protein